MKKTGITLFLLLLLFNQNSFSADKTINTALTATQSVDAGSNFTVTSDGSIITSGKAITASGTIGNITIDGTIQNSNSSPDHLFFLNSTAEGCTATAGDITINGTARTTGTARGLYLNDICPNNIIIGPSGLLSVGNTLAIHVAEADTNIRGDIINNGTITAANGSTVALNTLFVETFDNNGDLFGREGYAVSGGGAAAIFDNSGHLNGRFLWGGSLTNTGTLTIKDNSTLAAPTTNGTPALSNASNGFVSSGTINIAVTGKTTRGTDYSSITTTTSNLSGTINVDVDASAGLLAGDVLTLVDGSGAATLGSVTIIDNSSDISFSIRVASNGQDIELVVIADESTVISDPTTKADVMGTIQATSNAAIGFTSTSIKSVQNRLDWLRRNKDKEKTSYQGIKIAFSNPILNYIVNNNSLDFTTLTHQAVAYTNTPVEMNNPIIQTALSQMNKSASAMMKQVEDKYQVVSLNPNQSAGPLFNDWSIWTEGKIMAGSLDGSNGSADQDSDTLNIAIGMDRPTINAGLVGVALNLGTDDVEVGSAGSGIESKNISLSLYNIIQTKNLLDVETQLGLGQMSINTVRKDGSQTLTGDRDVRMPFASVAIRNKSFQYQAASLTPYGRAEWAYIELDSYTENGGNLALQYDKQKINRYMLFVGSDINYETSFASGRLKPFAALEYGLDLTSNSDVSMNYAGVNTKYQTQLEKVATSNVMLRLGLDYKREDEINFSISYERQEAIGAGNSDSIQFKFSKVLGKTN